MAIEKKIIEEAVKACSKNALHSADEAAIYNYIVENTTGEEAITIEELNEDLSYYTTDPHYGFLDQDESARFFVRGV